MKVVISAEKKKVLKGYILFYGYLTPELVRIFYRVPGVISFLNHEIKEKKLPDFVSEQAISSFLTKIQDEKKKDKIEVNHSQFLQDVTYTDDLV